MAISWGPRSSSGGSMDKSMGTPVRDIVVDGSCAGYWVVGLLGRTVFDMTPEKGTTWKLSSQPTGRIRAGRKCGDEEPPSQALSIAARREFLNSCRLAEPRRRDSACWLCP